MLGYDRIDYMKRLMSTKPINCIIALLLIFKINSRFQPKLCDGCHDLVQKSISFNDTVIVSVIIFTFGIWVKMKSQIYHKMLI